MVKNKSDEFEALLKATFHEDCALPTELIQETREKLHEREVMKMNLNKKKSMKWAVSIAASFTLMGGTAFAAWNLLNPSEVASEFENERLEVAFEGQGAIPINETQVSHGYNFNLLSIVSGEDLTDNPIFIDEIIQYDRTYAVVAITREDGTPMEESTSTFFSSPYVKGFAPWEVNITTLGQGGQEELFLNGVLYRIIDVQNLEVFAGHGVYLGISQGNFSFDAFLFDAETGVVSLNPDFEGSSVLFELPFDELLADEEQVQEILDGILTESEGELAEEEFELSDWEREFKEGLTYRKLSYDEFADFLEARIEQHIANGEPQAVISGARRDREDMLRTMRENNIEFAEVWYSEDSLAIQF